MVPNMTHLLLKQHSSFNSERAYMAKQLCDSKKQQNLFVQGYNPEVHDVIKYTRKHRANVTNYITCKPGFCVMQ